MWIYHRYQKIYSSIPHLYWLFSSLSNVIVKTGTVSWFIFLVSCEALRQRASLFFLQFCLTFLWLHFLLLLVVGCLVFTRSAYFKPIFVLVRYSVVWVNLAMLNLSNICLLAFYWLHFSCLVSFFFCFHTIIRNHSFPG